MFLGFWEVPFIKKREVRVSGGRIMLLFFYFPPEGSESEDRSLRIQETFKSTQLSALVTQPEPLESFPVWSIVWTSKWRRGSISDQWWTSCCSWAVFRSPALRPEGSCSRSISERRNRERSTPLLLGSTTTRSVRMCDNFQFSNTQAHRVHTWLFQLRLWHHTARINSLSLSLTPSFHRFQVQED